MKIDLIANDGSPLTIIPQDIYARGVGGAELSMIGLVEALAARGHTVAVYNDPRGGEATYGGVKYRPLVALNPMEPRDAIIIFRSPNSRLGPRTGAKKVIWWSCDQYTVGDFSALAKRVDLAVCISEYHRLYFNAVYEIRRSQSWATDLGVRKQDYEKNVETIPGKCIFCSIPDRGLNQLYPAWLKIKEAVPHATLVITSDYRLWGADPRNAQHRLAWAGLPGVTFVGAIPRKELCRHQQEAELMLYPSTYEELFCVSVAECSYAGAIPITSEKAALATTNEFGFKIPGQPGTLDFTNAFASMAIRLLETDRQYTATRRPTMMANAARRFSWDRIAKQWEYVLEKGEAPPEGLQ